MIERLLQVYTATIRKRGPATTTTDVFLTPVQDVATLNVEEPCWYEQTGSQEVLAGRETVLVDGRAYFRPTTDIDADDVIVSIVHNETGVSAGPFQVVGLPDAAATPLRQHHVEALLRLIAG